MLKPLGLDAAAESVYRAMITHRGWGVAQLARHLGVSETEVHTALDQLADLALVRQSLDDPGIVRPVDPEFGLVSLLQQRQAQLQRSQQELAESQAAITGMLADLQTSGGRVEVDQLVGIDEIQDRIEVLAGRARRECLSFMPGGAQSASSIEAGKPLNEAALRRGVAIRTVYLDSVRNDTMTRNYARWLAERGGEFRTTPTLPVRMLLVDSEIALLPVNPDDSREGALQLTSQGIIVTLTAFFDQVWAAASPLGEEPARDDAGLTGQERELLKLLGQGLTDEMSARRLGISLRTVRRMAADLMDRLGAKSRFEAGCRAVERGWL
ncbi:regulatory protein, luxR family [Amycolatopsis xylanica]|uniref:Regulatory protein, luxR family n=1 Tax=Amycolatopsis xylanica TaxID=589385 RepID=A0A1H3SCE9_9PSEU|nr:LuxR C-terminal-related transcriptional regulator [Amycolatopsis xylanica]SDZ35360.1 regulatory protein, luxR family [Amycolatopsis xylanica]